MNRINESKRLREAAEYEAETAKLVEIKKAEAEAESKRLQGEGVAAQRKAILKGLQEGVDNLAHTIGVTAEETMKYTMMAQYFDMLRDIGNGIFREKSYQIQVQAKTRPLCLFLMLLPMLQM